MADEISSAILLFMKDAKKLPKCFSTGKLTLLLYSGVILCFTYASKEMICSYWMLLGTNPNVCLGMNLWKLI